MFSKERVVNTDHYCFVKPISKHEHFKLVFTWHFPNLLAVKFIQYNLWLFKVQGHKTDQYITQLIHNFNGPLSESDLL
jgi:hypothetical protein